MFAAGHVRRMVNGGEKSKENENGWRVGVLSPRVQGVVGHKTAAGLSGSARRTTMSFDARASSHERAGSVGVGERATARLSATPQHGAQAMGHWSRPSMAGGGKSVWR